MQDYGEEVRCKYINKSPTFEIMKSLELLHPK